MLPRLGTGVGLALMLLATTVLLPMAEADHAYSHRYVIFGRLLDSEGNPVPGQTVQLGFRDVGNVEGRCATQPRTETDAFGRTEDRPVTNEFGEFMFCAHVHSLSRAIPGHAILNVVEANVTKEIELDVYRRMSYVPIELAEPHPNANKEALQRSYTVVGRLWREASADHVEGIRVFGETVNNAPVNVTLEYDGKTVTANTTTNNYGDFAVRVPVDSRPTAGTVRIQAEGETFSGAIEPRVGTTALKPELEEASTPIATSKTLWIVVGLLAAAGIVVGAFLAFRRIAAQREEASIRATAQRKRANK